VCSSDLYGRALIALGRSSEVTDVLSPLLKKALASKRVPATIQIRCLLALAYKDQDPAKALDQLEQALVAGEPEGFRHTYIKEGEPLAELLSQLIKKRAQVWKSKSPKLIRYVVQLQSLFQPASSKPKSPPAENLPAWYLPDPLSDRELEVLRHVAKGLSSAAIATKLEVAKTTVKRHISNVFLKLDVHSRTEALARARDFKLID